MADRITDLFVCQSLNDFVDNHQDFQGVSFIMIKLIDKQNSFD